MHFCSFVDRSEKAERRRAWTPKDRQRIAELERKWRQQHPQRPEVIREQLHDERARILRGPTERVDENAEAPQE
jgi:hypothetical protein